MKITNKLNLPEYIYKWLCKDDYDHNPDPNTISTTTLMKPIKIKILNEKYYDQLEIDASDLIASKLGSAIHDSLEKVEVDGVRKEERIARRITVNGTEYTITGKFDVLVTGTKSVLRDIKSTSVWAFIYGGKDDDYIRQLSIYRWLLQDQEDIDEAFIDFFFTDWQSSKAKEAKKDGTNYPQERIVAGYPIQLMSLEDTEDYIIERLHLFDEARQATEEELPDCTPEELWSTEEKFAIYKKGGKRATRVVDSMKEAKEYITWKGIDATIEHRPAKVKRCKYCACFKFCSQGQALNQQGLIILD